MPSFLDAIFPPPVYIFQMGKVGSSSLEATLKEHVEGSVVQAHTRDSMPVTAQRELTWRTRCHLPVHVICPIREPVARNVSAFFQNFKRDTGYETSDRHWTTEELVDLFLRCYPHNVCLEWFDRHFHSTFGIDVFTRPFSTEKKWAVYRLGSVKALIFRSDLDHATQLTIISDFLGREIKTFTYANQAENKQYRDLYHAFCASGRLPSIYLAIMGGSRFCQHFWNSEEIAANSSRWAA